jgi:hypothetical protein
MNIIVNEDIDRCQNLRSVNDFAIIVYKVLKDKYIYNDDNKTWAKLIDGTWKKDNKAELLTLSIKEDVATAFIQRSEFWKQEGINDKNDIYQKNYSMQKSNTILSFVNALQFNEKFLKNLIKETKIFFLR